MFFDSQVYTYLSHFHRSVSIAFVNMDFLLVLRAVFTFCSRVCLLLSVSKCQHKHAQLVLTCMTDSVWSVFPKRFTVIIVLQFLLSSQSIFDIVMFCFGFVYIL